MSKATFDKECKLCARPFTVFRWRSGGQPKKTEICQSCAKLKNLCQTCLLDLEFGLPAEIRDAGLEAMGNAQSAPTNTANREWFQQIQEQQMASGDTPWGRQGVANVVDALGELAPQYEKKRATQMCPFFMRGECAKGEHCPYRHDEVTPQSIAETANQRAEAKRARLLPPADQTIRTLYVGGLKSQSKITDQDLHQVFGKYGTLASVRVIDSKQCAFVMFNERHAAEQAVAAYADKGMAVRGTKLRVAWGLPPKEQRQASAAAAAAAGPGSASSSGPGSALFYGNGQQQPHHHVPSYPAAAATAPASVSSSVAPPPGAAFKPGPAQSATNTTTAAAAAPPPTQPHPARAASTSTTNNKRDAVVAPPPPRQFRVPPPPGAASFSYPSQDSRAVGGKRKLDT